MINTIITLTIVMTVGNGFWEENCETKLPIKTCLNENLIEYADQINGSDFNDLLIEFEEFIKSTEITPEMKYIDTDYGNNYPLIIASRLLIQNPEKLKDYSMNCYNIVLEELDSKNNIIDKKDILLRAKIFATTSLIRNILFISYQNGQHDIFYDYFEETLNSPFSILRSTSVYYVNKMMIEKKQYPRDTNLLIQHLKLLKQSENIKMTTDEIDYLNTKYSSRKIIQSIDESLKILSQN